MHPVLDVNIFLMSKNSDKKLRETNRKILTDMRLPARIERFVAEVLNYQLVMVDIRQTLSAFNLTKSNYQEMPYFFLMIMKDDLRGSPFAQSELSEIVMEKIYSDHPYELRMFDIESCKELELEVNVKAR